MLTWLSLQRIMLKGKNPIPKGCIVYEAIYMTFLTWHGQRNEQGARADGAEGDSGGKWICQVLCPFFNWNDCFLSKITTLYSWSKPNIVVVYYFFT